MKLYHQPRTRSARVRWLLGELGLASRTTIEQVNVFAGEGRRPEYLAVHPHGFVPALEEEEGVLLESSAICLYLVDRYGGGKLAPAPGTFTRGKYYEWMVYVPATVDPCLETIMFHTVFLPEQKRLPELAARAKKNFAQRIEPRFRAALEGSGPWILGEEFSAADVIAASALAWARMAGVLDEEQPAVTGYLERVAARPAFVEAYAT